MTRKLIQGSGVLLVGLLIWSQSSSINKNTMTNTNLEIVNTTEAQSGTSSLLVAGGCFWCVEADLEKLPGVLSAVSGYAGGESANPTYENYSKGGHREVVQVSYDREQVSFEQIIIYALKHMDPTDGEGSFFDRGVSYGPALYFETPAEERIIQSLIKEIDEQGPYTKPLAAAVEARPQFYPAEAYHQDYYKGTLSGLKYQYYRSGSGRDKFIESVWGADTGPSLAWRNIDTVLSETKAEYPWQAYVKPSQSKLQATLDELVFKVTQQDGTERAGTSPLDKEYGRGIYVDVLSGEPLFSSRDKFDSRTGWPSFTQPITSTAVSEHEDRKLFSVRIEVRSAIADNHLGHVFPDGPADRGGLRYCMNGVALRFIPEAEMAAAGYGDFIKQL